jgi:phage replication-related protein YjqB (UPF0714/DUF867 family)
VAGVRRPDKYPNFEMLRRAVRADDFRIDCYFRPSTVAIIAPHGGKIEPWTSAIATAIAADDYCLYCFEGRKRRENRDLHITSTHFDEPQCLTLVSGCDQVVAVHGCEGDEQVVYVGGLDQYLRESIRDHSLVVGLSTQADSHNRHSCNRSALPNPPRVEAGAYGFGPLIRGDRTHDTLAPSFRF